MLQNGIIKDFGDPISEGMIRQHYANYMMDVYGTKGSLRMYDIIKNNPKNFTLLKSVMNKMPVAIVGAGVGAEMMGDEEQQPLPQKKRGGGIKNAHFLASRNNGIINSLPKAQSEGELNYFTTSKKLNDEQNRISKMRNQIIPIAISHDATSDNRPFHVRLPEDQPYCTTRACEAEREAGFPIKQVASGYKLMNETTPENGWYPTSYDKLLPGDMAQVVRNSGFGHTMISTGNASNMPEQWRGNADPNQKGFYWDNGSGQDFQFASPKSEDHLAGWMNNVKKMNYYTYKGNLPQYEKEYQQATHNYLHDTSEGDYGPIAPIDAILNKKKGGDTKRVTIKSLPKNWKTK
jgi:hypothetical protein